MNKKLRTRYLMDAPELIAITILRRLRERVTRLSPKMLSPEIDLNVKVRWMNDFRCRQCSNLVHRMVFDNRPNDCSCCRSYLTTERRATVNGIKRLYFRSSEPEVEYVIRKHLKKDAVFVDIGACLGYYTSLALAICGEDGAVIAFEPMPQYKENFDYLKISNEHLNLKFFNSAVSNKEGIAIINAPKLSGSCNFIRNEGGLNVADRENLLSALRNSSEECEQIQISTVRFNDIFASQRVDFIKMDVEGHEVQILPTILDYIKSSGYRPHLVFEHENSYYNHAEIDTVEKYLSEFRSLGYKTHVAGTSLEATRFLRDITISVHCNPN